MAGKGRAARHPGLPESKYIVKKTPTGREYWVARDDPTKGYLIDPTDVAGAVAYPIEYINWLFRPSMPTAEETRPSSTGKESREIGGQALGVPVGVTYGKALIAPSVFFGPRIQLGNRTVIVAGFGLGHGPSEAIEDTVLDWTTLATLGTFYEQEFFPGVANPPAPYLPFVSTVDGASADSFEVYPYRTYVGAKMTYSEPNYRGMPTPYPIPKFVLKGRLVRNYVTGLDTWTDNPAYCTADYATSRRYGRGAIVNVNSVNEAAAYCDETFLNSATGLYEKKHTLNYFLLRQAQHKSHLDALRAHFRCNILERGGELIFSIQKDSAVVMSFDETTAVPIQVQRMGGIATPNVASVAYTDPSDKYSTKKQYARTAAVEAGLVPIKAADYELDGFNKSWWAASEAYFLLNTRLNNLRVVLKAFHPKARRLLPNDVIAYTQASFGMTGFLLRVIRVTRSQDGTAWQVECVGHDPSIYGFQSRLAEVYPLPSLPPIAETPPAPEDLAVSDLGNSVLGVDFTAQSGHPYYSRTRVTLDRTIGATTETFNLGEPTSGPLTFPIVGDAADYTAHAVTVLTTGAESAEADSNTLSMAGVAGPTGPAGDDGLGVTLTNEAHTVPSALDGSSPDLSAANGQVKVTSGDTDVTATATIGAATATGCTGTVNTATNTPVAGQPKGYYRVTAMSADTATLDIPVTFGGTTIVRRFSLAKSKQGVAGATGATGAAGANAKTLTVTSDRQGISYDETGAVSPSSQPTTFTANKQNTTAVVSWSATKADGTAISPITNLLSAATGDTVTMSAANFNTQRGTTEGVIVTATLTDGSTLTDRISVLRVQKGATGSTGPTGPAGASLFTPLTMGSGTITAFTPTSYGKTAGAASTYDASVYSAEGYVRGAFVALRPNQTNTAIWIGMSSAPAASVTETAIEYAWVFSSAGNVFVSLSGTLVYGPVAYTTGTRVAITYDGTYVRFLKDGVTVKEVTRSIGSALYLDSVFRDVSATAQVADLVFGPMGEQGIPAGTVLAGPNTMAGLGGRALFGPTTKLSADLTAGATSISVDAAVFANGDKIVLQTAPTGTQQTEFMTITSAVSGSGPYSYNVTRDVDGSGADAWKLGDTVVGLGGSSGSFIDLYTARGLKSSTEVGPSIVGNIRNSSTYNDWSPRWAIGNLNGLYGYNTDIFGAAFGVATGPWLKIDPVNGVRIGHNATTLAQVDAAGSGTIGGWTIAASQLSSGNIKLKASGTPHIGISSGTPNYNSSGTPFYADGAGLFSLGNKLTYDGSTNTLAITGAITATSGSIGGFTINAATLTSANVTISSMGQISTTAGVSGATLSATSQILVNGSQVLGTRGAAVADVASPNATDLASVIALANEMKAQFNTWLARARASSGHGLIN